MQSQVRVRSQVSVPWIEGEYTLYMQIGGDDTCRVRFVSGARLAFHGSRIKNKDTCRSEVMMHADQRR